MSKGLEAFKEIRAYLDYVLYDRPGTKAIGYTSTSQYLEPFMTEIEKELKDYENLKLKHRSMQDEVLNDFKKLKALEIIRNYGYFDEQGDLIVHLPTNRKEEHELLKEVLL